MVFIAVTLDTVWHTLAHADGTRPISRRRWLFRADDLLLGGSLHRGLRFLSKVSRPCADRQGTNIRPGRHGPMPTWRATPLPRGPLAAWTDSR
jgi:hypothetical protein